MGSEPTVRQRTGVVITAVHPTLGPLYWEFISEASVGGPDYHSITAHIDRALLLAADWRLTPTFKLHSNHMTRVLRDQVTVVDDYDTDGGHWSQIDFDGELSALHSQSGQSDKEFLEWIRSAEWCDIPGPVVVETLVDHGYFYEWERSKMSDAISHRGPVDLTVVYADGHEANRPADDVVISCVAAGKTVAVLLDTAVGFAMLSRGDVKRARLVLPVGTVIAGKVSEVSADYFELIEDGRE
ncbi:hypothetical protein [Pseudomonas nitroreducens]|uniref:hypothetical protein n=1 Tax=Pseudomonas nitroreducens TaxID=46680 RepID=UPI00265B56B6|nr:hypothetical protein [Pseudomonas nitroreducens]MCP1652303.1 hypothetical protein [Pseudomonas nitroreducens]MCP1689813.1 hypothetical protein [Pseudomonas nitroreducens]